MIFLFGIAFAVNQRQSYGKAELFMKTKHKDYAKATSERITTVLVVVKVVPMFGEQQARGLLVAGSTNDRMKKSEMMMILGIVAWGECQRYE